MPFPRRFAAVVVLALLALVPTVLLPAVAGGQGAGELERQIERQRGREGSLRSDAARLAQLERRAAREIAILQARLSSVQGQLEQAQAKLAESRDELAEERRRVERLEARLIESKRQLAALLRDRYVNGEPDLITVVLDADGFKDLLEDVEFIKRVEKQDSRIVDATKRRREEARRERNRLRTLVVKQKRIAEAMQRQRDAIAAIAARMAERRRTLQAARTARLRALSATRANRRKAERTLTRLLARQAREASSAGTPAGPGGPPRIFGPVSSIGPGGPWAIPWAVVQCESGGQNLTPNSAGASGYYQFMPATWKGLGGSTPHAYLAPKAEQDRLARRLWNGGKGASNWVCAGIVGIR